MSAKSSKIEENKEEVLDNTQGIEEDKEQIDSTGDLNISLKDLIKRTEEIIDPVYDPNFLTALRDPTDKKDIEDPLYHILHKVGLLCVSIFVTHEFSNFC